MTETLTRPEMRRAMRAAGYRGTKSKRNRRNREDAFHMVLSVGNALARARAEVAEEMKEAERADDSPS